MRKRVYIAYTGGTIGMKKAAGGYVPVPGYLQMQMEKIPELKSETLPVYDIHEYDPLLDSSNMTPRDWLKIAEDIAATMIHTTALSFCTAPTPWPIRLPPYPSCCRICKNRSF
jgi:L-asparaginase